MKYAVTDLSACRRSIAVDLPPDVVRAEYEKALREYAHRIRVDGFRRGKVPRGIVEQRFGREIEQEVVEHLIHDSSMNAIDEARLAPLHAPVLKDYKFDLGTGLTYTAEFEVRPSLEPKGYKGLKVERRAVQVTELDVQKALDELRSRRARFEGIEGRGVEAGDWVLADIAWRPDGEDAKPASHPDAFFETGSAGPHPELTDELRGMMPGQERTFGVRYPQDHPSQDVAGRRVVYEVKLKEIRTKRLPELDDEFAKEVGAFASLDELRARVRQDLEAMGASRERSEARRQLVDQILDANPGVDVPETLVEEQIDGYIEEMVRSMVAQGIDPETARVDWGEVRKDQREPASKSVRAMLLLDAIASAEKLEVESQEVDAAIEREASRRRQSADALRAKWDKEGRLNVLKAQILREKVLDFLLGPANI